MMRRHFTGLLIGLGFARSAKAKDKHLNCPASQSDYTFKNFLDAEEKYR